MMQKRIFVGGLDENLNKEDLEREFSKFGKLTSVWVAQNPPGFAFIEFNDCEDANEAVKEMDGVVVNGSKLRVEHSRERRGRGRGGGRGGGGGNFRGRGGGGGGGGGGSFGGRGGRGGGGFGRGRGGFDRPRRGGGGGGSFGGQSNWGRDRGDNSGGFGGNYGRSSGYDSGRADADYSGYRSRSPVGNRRY